MKKLAKAMYGKSMMQKGGTKKYQAGGIKKASGMKKATTMNPTSRNTAMTALGVDKKNQYSPSKFNDNVTSYARGTGAKKMQGGGAKPKAMYGTSMKSGMMKMGGTKKK